MMKKLGKTGGFTLIEMLIVVAIIAILIAVSIPMVNSSLETARDAADQANERSAKAAMLMVYMGVAETEENTPDDENPQGGSGAVDDPAGSGGADNPEGFNKVPKHYYYDAARGVLTANADNVVNIAAYGKCTEDCTSDGEAGDKFDSTTEEGSHEGKILRVYVSGGTDGHTAGEVVLSWVPNPYASQGVL